jgi:oligopeptidase B
MAPKPPVVPKRPVSRELFGEQFVDDYAWLRERDEPEVRALLEAETAYAETLLEQRTGDLRARLYEELRGRIREDDSSVPSKDGSWLYYSRTEIGDEYPRHCRRAYDGAALPEDLAGHSAEHVYVDENLLAEGQDFFDLARIAISPNHRLCAYAFDVDGDEVYSVCILDLDSGELLVDRLEGCGRSLAWADDQTLFYARLDEALRPWQAWRHRLGTSIEEDVCVWQEDDGKFYLGLHRTRSDAFVVLSVGSQVSSEVRLIPTATPEAEPLLVAARRDTVEYAVTHWGEQLFVLHNDGARNFAVDLVPLPCKDGAVFSSGRGHTGPPARTFIAHREHVLIEDIDVFAEYLVVWERFDGLPRVRVIPLEPMPSSAGNDDAPAPGEHLIEFPDPTYSVWADANSEFHTTTLRFGYTSLTTPDSIYDYDLRTRTRTLRKRTVVVGGHEPTDYRSARVWATAADGERVPISLVWRAAAHEHTCPASARPLLLEGYGAYGLTMDPSFSSARLSLLDRGAIVAIAHVRGGGELGRHWYDAGKLALKHNTFGDFIACAEHLIAERWTTPAQLVADGGSAGGLLIGAVANLRPELFGALILDVPFVDVLNTMLDPDLPLSLVERDEWGDPNTAEGFAWIRGYSPYENIRAQAYPDVLVLSSFNDTRVGYWEAAKWVARLREHKTDEREVLLWVNMDAGHSGASGRFEYLHELALEYAFLLDRFGLPG